MTYLLRLVACLFLCVSLNSFASLVNVTLSGHVSYVDHMLVPYFSVNDDVSIQVSYESDSTPYPETHFSNQVNSYDINSLSIQVGSYSFTNATNNNGLRVHNDVPSSGNLVDELFLPEWIYLTGLNIDGLDIPKSYTTLLDTSGLIFNDSRPPQNLPSLNYWSQITSLISYEDPIANAARYVRFEITAQSHTPVPLPAGIYLFLSGLVGLGLIRGRNG